MIIDNVIVVQWFITMGILFGCVGYLNNKIEKQSDRSDKLYKMFIDLLKEGRKQ